MTFSGTTAGLTERSRCSEREVRKFFCFFQTSPFACSGQREKGPKSHCLHLGSPWLAIWCLNLALYFHFFFTHTLTLFSAVFAGQCHPVWVVIVYMAEIHILNPEGTEGIAPARRERGGGKGEGEGRSGR